MDARAKSSLCQERHQFEMERKKTLGNRRRSRGVSVEKFRQRKKQVFHLPKIQLERFCNYRRMFILSMLSLCWLAGTLQAVIVAGDESTSISRSSSADQRSLANNSDGSPGAIKGTELSDGGQAEEDDDWAPTSELPSLALSTTSSFDRMVSGDEGATTAASSAKGNDVDYIMANLTPTEAPDSPEATTNEELPTDQMAASVSANGHQSTSGTLDHTASLLSDDPDQRGTKTRIGYTRSITTTSPVDESSTSFLSSADLGPEVTEPSSAELAGSSSAAGQLVRNRKSPDNGTNSDQAERTPKAKATVGEQVRLESNSSSPMLAPSRQTGDGQSVTSKPSIQMDSAKQTEQNNHSQQMASFGAIDYEDFDLDYQLKLNASGPQTADFVALGGQNMNKRDNDNAIGSTAIKPPSWSTLMMPSHVFTPTTNNSPPSGAYYHQVPPMIPSVLTVKSTPLTTQELNKIRPQFLLNQDSYDTGGNSYGIEQSQAFANGDLLAIASGGGMPATSQTPLNGSRSEPTMAESQKGNGAPGGQRHDSTINLLNGSPLIRQGAASAASQGRADAKSSSSPKVQEDSPHVTTIVVDNNTTPTEAPPATQAISSPSPQTARSTPTSNATSRGPSQANQWFRYPHPNLHHNPLLLHHILNKPSIYAQHVGANQPASDQSHSPSSSSSTTTGDPLIGFPSSEIGSTTASPVGQTSTSSPLLTSSMNMFNIVEKPTISTESIGQPAPINRTQLQMQLNEMRAIAASSGLKAQGVQVQQQQATSFPATNQNSLNQHLSMQAAQQAAQLQSSNLKPQQLGWQKVPPMSQSSPTTAKLAEKDLATPDYLSHLVGAKTRANISPANGGLYQPLRSADHLQNGFTRLSLENRFNELPMRPPMMDSNHFFPLNRPHPSTNMMHHLFGNNLSGANLNQQPYGPFAPNFASSKPLVSHPLMSMLSKPKLFAPFLAHRQQEPALDARQNGQLIAQAQHSLQQQQHNLIKSQVPSQIVAAPSLQQEVYASRPASMQIGAPVNSTAAATTATSTMPNSMVQSGAALSKEAYDFLRQLAGNQTSANSRPYPESSAQTNPKHTTMSDEDMSTYVAQLASFNAQVNQSPNLGQQSGPSWSGRGSQNSNLKPAVDNSLLDLQLSMLLQQLKPFDAQGPSLEALVQKLSDPQVAASQQASQQSNSWAEMIKGARLIGLSDEVQAQIYREHLAPAQQAGSEAKPSNNPYSPLTSPVTGPKFSSDLYRSFASPAASIQQADSYSSIDGHQRQQKKDKQELQLQLRQQQQNLEAEQRQKQLAFIEALRSSVMKLQASSLADAEVSSPGKLYSNSTSFEDLSQLAGSEYYMTNSSALGNSATSVDDFDEQAPSKPIPEWLERQIIQESLIHETSRINPFGHTAKSTIIDRHHPASLIALRPRPAAILRPLGSHLHPSNIAPRPVYPLHPIRASQLHSLASNHHYHHHSPPALAMHRLHSLGQQQPASPMLAESSQPPAAHLQSSPMSPMNPTKLLADRFPLVSAPAYLVKLPTLTGGTITASGSFSPPSRLLASRPSAPLRFLSTVAAMAPPKIRLVPQMMQPASSMPYPLHQSPPSPAHAFYHTSPSSYHAVHHHHPSSYQPALFSPLGSNVPMDSMQHILRPAPLILPLGQQHYHDTGSLHSLGSASPAVAQSPGELTSTQPPSSLGSRLQLLPSNVATTPASSSQAQQTRQYQANPDSNLANNQQSANQAPMVNESPAGQSSVFHNPAATALNRLQQATASLVELTSLASLVEEMVSGSDIESSPAAALASAINSISAAQNNALNAQASTNGPQSSQTGGVGSDHNQQFQPTNSNQVVPIFSWRNLLNPNLWRDKSGTKGKEFTALERLVATAARRPPARLKVKYIRVPVAVYETQTTNGGVENAGILIPPSNQLVTKAQLAEIVASGVNGGGSTSASSDSSSNPPSATNGGAGNSMTSINSNAPSSTNAVTSPNTPGSVVQPGGATPVPAASSADSYLFDELNSENSIPQLTLAQLQDHYLSQQGDELEQARLGYLPMITTIKQPMSAKRPLGPLNPLGGELNPLESALYYSLVASPSSANQASSGGSSETKTAGKKRKKGRKGKKGDDEEEEEREEEEDDDDLLSNGDLPLLESIISTLVHGQSPSHSYAHSQSQLGLAARRPPTGYDQMSAASSSPWRPFGGFKAEPSTNVETVAHPLAAASHSLNLFGKNSHRFSLGEVVGALGARKLITSLLNKRGKTRTSKRATGQNRPPSGQSNNDKQPIESQTKSPQEDELFFSSTLASNTKLGTHSSSLVYPPIAAYDHLSTKSTKNKPVKRKFSDVLKPVISQAVAGSSKGGQRDLLASGHSHLAHSLSSSTTNQSSSAGGNIPITVLVPLAPVTTTTTTESSITSSSSPTTLNSVDSSSSKTTESSGDSRVIPSRHTDDVRINFFQLKTSQERKNDSNADQGAKLPPQKRMEDKMAMPLYHVVADHYSKLYSGPVFHHKSALYPTERPHHRL